jgi:hypothetical protein
MAVRMTLNNNGQAITLKQKTGRQGADGASLAKMMAAESANTPSRRLSTGTHAMWLYY